MEHIDRLREEYDYVILRGSNYDHQHMDWTDTIPVLKRLGLPVIAFGIGAQAPVKGQLELSEANEDSAENDGGFDGIDRRAWRLFGPGSERYRHSERAHYRLSDRIPPQRSSR